MALLLVPDSGRDVGEGVAPVDDRGYLAVLDEFGQRGQVVFVRGGPDRVGQDHSLGYQWRQRERREHARGGLEPQARRPTDGDEGPVGFQRPHRGRCPAAAGDVQQQVVVPALAGEVLCGVVDDLGGAEGLMRDGGFSYDLAHHALHALGSRALGFSQEPFDPGDGTGSGDATAAPPADMASQFPHLAAMLAEIAHDDPASTLGWCDDQTEFEFGLDLILNGLDSLRRTP